MPAPPCASQETRALLGRQRAAGAAQDAGGLGREVRQPPDSTSAGRAVGDRRAVGEQHHPLGERRDELGVVGGDEHRGVDAAQQRGQARACRVRSMPRVGSSRHTTAGGSASSSRTIASASRCRSPPDRSRGWRSASAASPADSQRGGAASSRDRLVDEVVARVLEQQRDAARRSIRPRVGFIEAGRVAQQRRLAGAVSAHERDALARADRERHAAQDAGPSRRSRATRGRSRSAASREAFGRDAARRLDRARVTTGRGVARVAARAPAAPRARP